MLQEGAEMSLMSQFQVRQTRRTIPSTACSKAAQKGQCGPGTASCYREHHSRVWDVYVCEFVWCVCGVCVVCVWGVCGEPMDELLAFWMDG